MKDTGRLLALVAVLGVVLGIGWQLNQIKRPKVEPLTLTPLVVAPESGVVSGKTRPAISKKKILPSGRLNALERQIGQARSALYSPDKQARVRIELLTQRLDGLTLLVSSRESLSSPRLWWLLGLGYYLVGDRQMAEQALMTAPDHPQARWTLARLYLERAMALRRTSLGLTSNREAILLRAGSLAGRALELLQDDPTQLGAAYRALAAGKPTELRAICQRELLKERASEEYMLLLSCITSRGHALDLLTRALRRRPHYDAALWLRAYHRTESNQLRLALNDVGRAIALVPRFAQAYFCRAWINFYQMKDESALRDMNRAIKLAPGDADARIWRGGKLAERGDFKGATSDFDEAVRLEPKEATHYLHRGLLRRNLGDLEGATKDLDQSLELRTTALGHAHRGAIRYFTGNLAGTLEDCNRAIAEDASLAMPYGYRGAVQLASGNARGAQFDCSQAIKLDRTFGLAYFNRGQARIQLGNMSGAISDLTRSLQQLPRKAPSFYYRGVARRQQGDISGAIRDYSFAIELESDLADAYRARGEAYMLQGDGERAARDLRVAERLEQK